MMRPWESGWIFFAQVEDLHGDGAFGYCTNFRCPSAPISMSDACRKDLTEMGDSAVIVGDRQTLKVSHSCDEPRSHSRLRGGSRRAGPDQDRQYAAGKRRELARQHGSSVTDNLPADPGNPEESSLGGQAVLAVAAGAGLSEALRSMGASAIVAGGQTMNPSIEELLAAVESMGRDEVIILPNNPNIVLTANQIADLTSKRVGVVPSRFGAPGDRRSVGLQCRRNARGKRRSHGAGTARCPHGRTDDGGP